jgi:archaellum biogenesis ATPase FlaH
MRKSAKTPAQDGTPDTNTPMNETDSMLSGLAEGINQQAAFDRFQDALSEGKIPEEADRRVVLGDVNPIPVEHRRAAEDMREKASVREADEMLDTLLGGMKVTLSEAERFIKPDWAYQDLIVEGHIIVVPSEPNGGKTTIFWSICPGLTAKGYTVWYINSDISSADVQPMIAQAEEHGINLVLPDMSGVDGMTEATKRLRQIATSNVNLKGKVFIVDTLKKVGTPNDKNDMAGFFKLCRRLTSMGATMVLLAHTLKYYGMDGLPQYEGVGDIKADCDDLVYLIPQRQVDGTVIVSTHIGKRRADYKPISFRINEDRSVDRLETYCDLRAEKAIQASFAKDKENVNLIHDLLSEERDGEMNQTDILKYTGLAKNAGILLLARYEDRQWTMTRKPAEKNQKIYSSLPIGERHPE